jgi:chemotaxis protein MotB
MKHIAPPLILCAALLLPGCVAKKKYLEATGHVERLQADSTESSGRIAGLEAMVAEQGNLLDDKRRRLDSLGMAHKQTQDQLADREALLQQKGSELVDKARQMDDLTRRLDAQTSALSGLRKKVADALVNFRGDELSVDMRDGRVYVSLSEKLLFKSGSAEVDPKGREAIGQLAEVLRTVPDVGVMVEGHTDTIPIAGGRLRDNWELSTVRATSIVRIMTEEKGLDPLRVTAAGRGEWMPVASNRDAEGRARNRRTEIILTPDLRSLFELIGEP